MKICPVCSFEALEGNICPRDGAMLQIRGVMRDPLLGMLVKDRYRLEKRIGEGGMGAIYRAEQLSGGPPVAIKVLLPDSGAPEEHVLRFYREAEMLGALKHPNIVSLLDFGRTEKGILFMVMEYLTGKTLEQVVARGQGVPVDSAVAVLEEVCAGVGAAHKMRLVHRDLKPDNIFIARRADGAAVVKVIDFGLAKPMQDDNQTSLTMTGKVVGSAGYIAPEHILGSREFTDSSDIYGLGAVLYFMLTGRKPYHGQSIGQIMQAQVYEKPPPLGLPDDAPAQVLAPVVAKAMARNSQRRFKTVEELIGAIHQAIEDADDERVSTTELDTLQLSGLTIARQSMRRIVGSVNHRYYAAFVLGAAAGGALLALLWWVFTH